MSRLAAQGAGIEKFINYDVFQKQMYFPRRRQHQETLRDRSRSPATSTISTISILCP